MNSRTVINIILANLVAVAALALIYPHLVVSPGALIEGHRELTGDCFACHSALRGADAQKCIGCHRVATIGIRTSKGEPIVRKKIAVAFHQDLAEQDCTACHSDHRGMLPYRTIRAFSHDVLPQAVRERCEGCHKGPADSLHRTVAGNCLACHDQHQWNPATFSHQMLGPKVLARCEGCHRAPGDTLHEGISGGCGSCHAQERWEPATFDHDKHFRLDHDHRGACTTCHVGNDYKRYTCYGCHEHSPDGIRAEHLEEGIRDYENCVQCHRSADEEEAEHGRYGESRWAGGERGDDDD